MKCRITTDTNLINLYPDFISYFIDLFLEHYDTERVPMVQSLELKIYCQQKT